MFYLWRRMGEEDRGRVWRLYGWFTALMTCGSCFGAVARTAQMMFTVNYFRASVSSSINSNEHFVALAYSWLPSFVVTYAVEFLCMCAAKLMVLDRMATFAAPEDPRLQTRWAAAGRVVMAAVVLGNAVGLAANVAAAVHYQEAANAKGAASAYFAMNSTKLGTQFKTLGREEMARAGSIESVQFICEVAVLLLIVVAFVVVGLLCARILRSRFKPGGVDAGYDAFMATVGSKLRLQMAGTTALVFVTFLLRAVFSTMQLVAWLWRDIEKQCAGVFSGCDASCYNVYQHISTWMLYTPEFQQVIILISSPLAQLAALWSMTPTAALQLNRSSRQDTALSLSPLQP